MPATVTVPTRGPPRSTAALKLTEPFPVPDAGAVTVIHGRLATAVQEQAAPVFTVIVPAPPLAGTVWIGGVTV
jgi:hypothetical protein